MDAKAALGSFGRKSAGLCERLTDCHPALDAVRTRALHFAVNVEHRHTMHVDHVARRDDEVLVEFLVEEHPCDVDLPAKGLAFSRASDDSDVPAGSCNAAPDCDHFRKSRVES